MHKKADTDAVPGTKREISEEQGFDFAEFGTKYRLINAVMPDSNSVNLLTIDIVMVNAELQRMSISLLIQLRVREGIEGYHVTLPGILQGLIVPARLWMALSLLWLSGLWDENVKRLY